MSRSAARHHLLALMARGWVETANADPGPWIPTALGISALTHYREPGAFEAFLEGYLECLLWSTVVPEDERGTLGAEHWDGTGLDWHARSLRAHTVQVFDFFRSQQTDLRSAVEQGHGWENLGHDFCLTRGGHGAGFWDRGLGVLGDRLTEASEPYGDVYLYATARGRIGIEG